MDTTALALTYAGLAALPAAMHLGLAAGQPWGRFTIGGRYPGRLAPLWRGLALVQAAVLAAMTCAILDRAGVIGLQFSPVLFWAALAMTILTTVANAASPSRPERLLWTPVTLAMSACAFGVALL